MSKKDFLAAIDEIVGRHGGPLTGNERLDSLPRWDSIAIMEFIAMLDERCGIGVLTDDLLKCETVGDLILLTNGKVHD